MILLLLTVRLPFLNHQMSLKLPDNKSFIQHRHSKIGSDLLTKTNRKANTWRNYLLKTTVALLLKVILLFFFS